MATLQELDRRVVEVGRALVHTVTPDRLRVPTPCADWDLAALLAHMTVQHHGFARAVAGAPSALADWQPVPIDDDPIGHYDDAADHVNASFADPGALDRSACLPEIRGGVTVPASMAIGFHFVDYVVHAWDVARALRVPVDFDDEVLAMALVVAGQVPNDPASRGAGLAFAPALPEPPGGVSLDRVLTMLGRSPNWGDEVG